MFYTNVHVSGDNILLRGINDAGKSFKEKIPYKPTLFVNCQKETKYKDIYNNFCAPVKFGSIKDCNEWLEESKITQIEVLGMQDYNYAYIADTFPGEIKYDITKLRIVYLDIEVYAPDQFPDPTKSEYPIDALTMYDSITKKFYVFSSKLWDKSKSKLNESITKNTIYKFCGSEKELLTKFLQHWKENYPDIVTGWNSNTFDLVTIYKRLKLVLGETNAKTISPWNIVYEKQSHDKYGNDIINLNLYGISLLDYRDLYKKFTYDPRAFYSLDYISKVELNEKKIKFKMTHAELSDSDPQTYIDYNIKDVWLVTRLDVKLNLMLHVAAVTYKSHINFRDVLSPVKTWDAIIFNILKNKNIVVPKIKRNEKVKFKGAYVKEVRPGFYRWVISFDAASLYPLILNTYNISPETIMNKSQEELIELLLNLSTEIPNSDLTYAANGMQYTKEFKGVVPGAALEVFDSRKIHKKKQLEYEALADKELDKNKKQEYKDLATIEEVFQMAAKYSINSLYGILGSPYFRYYNLDNAEAVTACGRLIIRYVEQELNKYFDKMTGIKKDRCIAIDTDSVYFCIDDFVQKYLPNKSVEETVEALDRFCKEKLSKYLDETTTRITSYTNSYENRINFKRELICDTAFWRSSKKYAANVRDKEGIRYTNPKVKIMGLESQQSSTPEFVQDAMAECTRIILQENNDNLIKYIEDFERVFKSQTYDVIAGSTSINGVKKYADSKGNPTKGAQSHVKGALAYNKLYKNGIKDGDKISVLPLKVPNKFNSLYLAYPASGLPNELEEYVISKVNKQELWNKVFLDSIKLTTKACNWKVEDTADLSSFFV